MKQETKWTINQNLPLGLEEATRKNFRPISSSARLNLGEEHNWRDIKVNWYDGIVIGHAEDRDQFGNYHTWEVSLWQAGGTMMSCEGASRWQILIDVIKDCCFERQEFGKCRCAFKNE